jgi:transcriptional regulator with XRE-family HTH domain
MNTTGKGFGKRLRKLRKAAGLTQAALGEKVGVHPVSIAQGETGVYKPSEKSAAKLMAFFDGAKATPADPPVPKKRGRPRKEKSEAQLDPKLAPPAAKVGRVKEETPAVPGLGKTRKRGAVAEDEAEAEAKKSQDQLGAERSPVRRGLVSGAWVDQQVESFVKARGHIFQDGPVRVVVMSRPDVLALCKLMLEVGAVRVE